MKRLNCKLMHSLVCHVYNRHATEMTEINQFSYVQEILGGLNRIPCEEGMPSKTEWTTDQCINFFSVTKIEFNRWQLAKTQFSNHTL